MHRLYHWPDMQTLRGLSLALAVAAALGLVFYNGASRRLEIGLFVALFATLVLFGSFTKAQRPRDEVSAVHLDAKQIWCWLFAWMSLKYVVISLQIEAHRRYALMSFWDMPTVILYAIVPIVSGIAWWTAWKRKPLARGWGIAASVLYLLVFLDAFVFFPSSIWWRWRYAGAFLIGEAGIIEFLPSDKQNERNAPAASVSA